MLVRERPIAAAAQQQPVLAPRLGGQAGRAEPTVQVQRRLEVVDGDVVLVRQRRQDPEVVVDGAPARLGRCPCDDEAAGIRRQQLVEMLGALLVLQRLAQQAEVGQSRQEQHVVAELREPGGRQLGEHGRGRLGLTELGVDQRHRGRGRRVRRRPAHDRQQCPEIVGPAALHPHREHLMPVDQCGVRVAGPLDCAAGPRARAPRHGRTAPASRPTTHGIER